VSTLGSGAPMGMEGLAIHSAVIATLLRGFKWTHAISSNGRLAAGTATGIAAVFIAPGGGCRDRHRGSISQHDGERVCRPPTRRLRGRSHNGTCSLMSQLG
jgi:hypothetical protein